MGRDTNSSLVLSLKDVDVTLLLNKKFVILG